MARHKRKATSLRKAFLRYELTPERFTRSDDPTLPDGVTIARLLMRRDSGMGEDAVEGRWTGRGRSAIGNER